MIPRLILSNLQEWAGRKDAKPLIIRGARQVGKTTVVHQLGEKFDHFLKLNLERPADQEAFGTFTTVEELLQRLFFFQNIPFSPTRNTLLFLDEIQAYPPAIPVLRYLYEEAPQLRVIAAGSLLESLLAGGVTFPVGRVTYRFLRPISFPEFLLALGEEQAFEQLLKIPLVEFARPKLRQLFREYVLVGGMPEVVQQYSQTKDLVANQELYEALFTAYLDDVEKYASSDSQRKVIRHAIRAAFIEAGNRIKFQGFGKSNYRSREMGEALRTLEQALLLQLMYPCTQTRLPILPNQRKSPRLQVLDTGLLSHFAGLQAQILRTNQLQQVFEGKLIEHVIGQELLASSFSPTHRNHFWVREKKTSVAEVDFVVPFAGWLIPVEVKAGKSGSLRSLLLYMEDAPHPYAVRLYDGPVKLEFLKPPNGKAFQLLNLPYQVGSQLNGYLSWAFE
ncbi:MAG: AAA family ATPase [Bacteroidota bacterium]